MYSTNKLGSNYGQAFVSFPVYFQSSHDALGVRPVQWAGDLSAKDGAGGSGTGATVNRVVEVSTARRGLQGVNDGWV